MNNAVFGKTMENVRKHRDIKFATTERRRFITETLLAIEMRKTQIFINKFVYLGLSILDLSKAVKYKFWYDYVKPDYFENAKLC